MAVPANHPSTPEDQEFETNLSYIATLGQPMLRETLFQKAQTENQQTSPEIQNYFPFCLPLILTGTLAYLMSGHTGT